jgi:hypothetical protein
MKCTHILAQLSAPTGSEFLGVLGSLLFIAMIVSLYFTIMANRKRLQPNDTTRHISPSPLDVRNVHDFVAKPQLEKLENEMDRKFEHIYQVIREEGRRVDSRVNDVLTEVSKLSGAFNQSQRRHHPHDG